MLQCYRVEVKTSRHCQCHQTTCFKQNNVTPDNLPVQWKHNKKAWITTAVFEDWLNQLNETMKKKKRRIILFVDNATSHVVSKKMSNVHVKFLPPHLTSELQPLDQGIIQAMKANYRKSIYTACWLPSGSLTLRLNLRSL